MDSENKFNVAFLSSYPPRMCGIGEFTADVVRSVGNHINAALILPIDNEPEGSLSYLYPITPECIVHQMNSSDYKRVAELVAQRDFSAKVGGQGGRYVVDAEHEFGLDGNGRDNNYNLFGRTLNAEGVRKVIRLHTVLDPALWDVEQFQIDITKEMGKVYDMIVVITRSAKEVLVNPPYDLDPDKIVVIPHGIVEGDRSIGKESRKGWFGLEGRVLYGTPGMVSRVKGIEYELLGFAEFLKILPPTEKKRTHLIIYGGTHPEVLRFNEGRDQYREEIMELAFKKELKLNPLVIEDETINRRRNLKLDDNRVIFVNTHVRSHVLERFIGSLDCGVTTYTSPTQSSSGIGAKLAGWGIPCVSSNFMFHNDLFRDENGRIDNSGWLVKFKRRKRADKKEFYLEPEEIAKGLAHVREHYAEMRPKILSKGVIMGWSVVGAQNFALYRNLWDSYKAQKN